MQQELGSRLRFISVSERILLTLWIGGLWSIGYMAVPTLFTVLDDRLLAGEIAGNLFHVVNYLGLVCGTLLLLSTLIKFGKHWLIWVLITMLILVSLSEFRLQPMMHELKLLGLIEGTEQQDQFRLYHGLSQVIYLVNALLGLTLVIFNSQVRGEQRR